MAEPTKDIPPIEPQQVESITRNDAGLLVLRIVGQEETVEDVRIARCFPWSMPEQYISIRSAQGKEICLLQNVEQLPPDSRQVVLDELQQRIFNPKIHRVTAYKSEFGVASITAMTDRGEVTFQIRGRDDIRFLSGTRALFKDVDGNVYELPDINALDPASRKHFHEYF